MGLWQTDNTTRAPAETPTLPGENTTRTRSRESEARESGEETYNGDQEVCQKWTDGRMQDSGQRSRTNAAVYSEILQYADTITSSQLEDPDRQK